MKATRLIALVLVLATGACGPGIQAREYSFFAFGTLVRLTLVGVNEERAEHARTWVASRLHHYHNAWHAWEPSPLTRLNAALAKGQAVTPDSVLQPLLKPARRYARLSGGLFNPAIGKLIGLWGFHADQLPAGPPPERAAIAALAGKHPALTDLVWRDGKVSSTNPAVQLDFGAFAKGVAVERIVTGLKARGFDNVLLDAGGDLKVLGTHGNRPWRIGIRDPDGQGVLAAVEARPGEAVFTSGDYERYFEWNGKRYHHLIDPRTGYPARGTHSVTVITQDAALADAAATALFVAGAEGWPQVAAHMGVSLVLLIDDEGVAHMSPAMAQRVKFVVEPAPPVVIEAPES